MAATALSLRLPLAGTRRAPVPGPVCGLAFQAPATVVAVCGLAGGAGTTTLAWLLARQAARESPAPVLVCEPEAIGGGLADRAGCASTTALGELGELVDAGQRPPAGAFAALPDGLRMIAAGPRQAHAPPAGALARVLSDARAAHGLVVCDCRTLDHPAVDAILAQATHVLWTLPATAGALAQARAIIAADSLPAAGRAREALVAVATHRGACTNVRDLRALAATRLDRLVLVPHTPELAAGGETDRRSRLTGALTQLATFLRGPQSQR